VTKPSALSELAGLYGIQASYLAVDGSTRVADKDVVMALLRSLEAPVDNPHEVTDALRARRLADARRVLEPVVVQRTGRPSPVTVTLPEGVDPRQVRVCIDLEDGAGRHEGSSLRLVLFSGVEMGGGRYGLYRLDLAALETEPVPPGYHRLVLEAPGASSSALLIVAPNCPAARRGWPWTSGDVGRAGTRSPASAPIAREKELREKEPPSQHVPRPRSVARSTSSSMT